jgi:hypothetical protein
MNFEQLVRPVMGEDYDTRFPARSTATPDLNAELSEAEAAFIADWARLYSAASNLGSVEKIRHRLIGALKTIRLDAEARKRRELALAARGGRPKYRYRVCTPDGTEVTYPKIGTIYADERYALLWRQLPTDPAVVRLHVERHYKPYVTHARQIGDEEREEKLLAAIERDLAVEIARDEARVSKWGVWTFGANLRRIEGERDSYANRGMGGELPPRHQYEYIIAEGTPFPV